MKIKRIKYNNIKLLVIGLFVILLINAAARPLEDLRRTTNNHVLGALTGDEIGLLTIGMILISFIAAVKLLTNNRPK